MRSLYRRKPFLAGHDADNDENDEGVRGLHGEQRPIREAPQDRSAEHRQDGDRRRDGTDASANANDRGGPPKDGEVVSDGKSEKDLENAKGKGKKRGWWGRLFGDN